MLEWPWLRRGFVPHWLPSARHTPFQSSLYISLSLSLCIKPRTFYQTRPSRSISTQPHPLKGVFCISPSCCCCCQVITFGAPSSLILTVQHVGRLYWQNGRMSNEYKLKNDFLGNISSAPRSIFNIFHRFQAPGNIRSRRGNPLGHSSRNLTELIMACLDLMCC